MCYLVLYMYIPCYLVVLYIYIPYYLVVLYMHMLYYIVLYMESAGFVFYMQRVLILQCFICKSEIIL